MNLRPRPHNPIPLFLSEVKMPDPDINTDAVNPANQQPDLSGNVPLDDNSTAGRLFEEKQQEDDDLIPFESEQPTNVGRQPVARYKHKSIRNFRIGDQFEFDNHVLTLFTVSENEQFREMFKGLNREDQGNIKRLPLNNAPVTDEARRITRGTVGTGDVIDRTEPEAAQQQSAANSLNKVFGNRRTV